MTRRTSLTAAIGLAAVLSFLPATVASAAPLPAWKLTAIALPSNFTPGETSGQSSPYYIPMATNAGAAPTSGEITLEATLPPGVIPGSAIGVHSDPLSPFPDCVVAGQTVTCTTEAPLHPGRWLGAKVGVDVDPGLPLGEVSAEASVSGGGPPGAAVITSIEIGPDPAPFDFLPGPSGFSAPLSDEDGAASTQAGSHPERLTVDVGLPVEVSPSGNSLNATEHPRSLGTELPRGTVVNPQATPTLCTEAQLMRYPKADCPASSQIGTVTVTTTVLGPTPLTSPLFNMVPPQGKPSSFGFDAAGVGIFVHIIGAVRSDEEYQLVGTANDILARGTNPVLSTQLQLWGDPSSPVHDDVREANVEDFDTALLTMPTECTGKPTTAVGTLSSWEHPEDEKRRPYESADLNGAPVSVDGCNQLEFKPTIEAKPTTNLADSPSGLEFNLHQPQNTSLDGLSTAIARDVTLTLPEGMTVNPASADGQVACPAGLAHVNDNVASQCPNASKLGSVEVRTPLLGHPLPGALYLAEPYENPFGSLIAIYLSVDDPKSGTIANLAGQVTINPVTGQLSNTFKGNPELPLEDVRVSLFKGPRASLRTPPACATYTSVADITPWSTPETADAHPSDSFAITAAPGGGSCPSSAQEAPHAPTFSAGTIDPLAGSYSPFLLKVNREDATQPLAGVQVTMPPGLSGKLAGIASCSEAQIAAAKAREKPELGALEKASPSCPASSEVGTVDVAAGAGISPLHVEGKAYLAGPYKGAPLSLVIITPAVAGPFDLGAVVVRNALHLDPKTAQIHAVSDPLPQALEGIPLDVRSISLRMGRPQFTLNPTSCDPMQIASALSSTFGALASPSSPFQVGGCQQLPFKPKLNLRLKGATKRGSNPKLIATLKAKPGEAGIARTSVTLPRSAFLDQSHIRTICTRVQFAADACPQGSIYGKATATTPLLDYPISGPAYLRSSDNQLPDLVMALKGPDHQPIAIELAGRTDSVKGALRNTFDLVPDAPVSRFRLELFGGKRGLVINSRNLCAQTYRATVEMVGQNGKAHDARPAVANDCKKAKRKGGKGAKGKRGR